MIIRDATPADARAIAEVHIRAWQSAYRGLLPDEHLDDLSVEERVARYKLGPSAPRERFTILAADGEDTRGFAMAGRSRDEDAPDHGEIYALYVDPSCWKRGVGRLLLAGAVERLRGLGFAEAILWVLAGNEPAERFYGSDGWLRDGASRYEEVYGVGADVIRYRRRLD